MDTRVCPGCMGSGEAMTPSASAGRESADYDLVTCPRCHGMGQVPDVPIGSMMMRSEPKHPKGKHPAVLRAIEAIEKVFGKKR